MAGERSDRSVQEEERGRGPEPGEQQKQEEILARLRKIEGQIRGIQRMVESGRRCEDVLLQVSAAVSALRHAGIMMLGCALSEAMERAVREDKDPGAELERIARTLVRLS